MYLLDMEDLLYGLITKYLKALDYNLTVKNNKSHLVNILKEEAGTDWVQEFLNSHPEKIRKHLSLVQQVISIVNTSLHHIALTTASKLVFQLNPKQNQRVYTENRSKARSGVYICGKRGYYSSTHTFNSWWCPQLILNASPGAWEVV